jgi:hypothetical protein
MLASPIQCHLSRYPSLALGTGLICASSASIVAELALIVLPLMHGLGSPFAEAPSPLAALLFAQVDLITPSLALALALALFGAVAPADALVQVSALHGTTGL